MLQKPLEYYARYWLRLLLSIQDKMEVFIVLYCSFTEKYICNCLTDIISQKRSEKERKFAKESCVMMVMLARTGWMVIRKDDKRLKKEMMQ